MPSVFIARPYGNSVYLDAKDTVCSKQGTGHERFHLGMQNKSQVWKRLRKGASCRVCKRVCIAGT